MTQQQPPQFPEWPSSKRPVSAWVDWQRADRFLDLCDTVLNSQTLLVGPFPYEGEVADAVLDAIGQVAFGTAFQAAYARREDGELWDDGTYGDATPDAMPSPLDVDGARGRMVAMLTGTTPYSSPYHRAVTPQRALREVSLFLDAFIPPPTLFAELEPGFLGSLNYLDGFNDSVLVIASGRHFALLVNNGTD